VKGDEEEVAVGEEVVEGECTDLWIGVA